MTRARDARRPSTRKHKPETWQRARDYTRKPERANIEWEQRACLRCGGMFWSRSKFNRLCGCGAW